MSNAQAQGDVVQAKKSFMGMVRLKERVAQLAEQILSRFETGKIGRVSKLQIRTLRPAVQLVSSFDVNRALLTRFCSPASLLTS